MSQGGTLSSGGSSPQVPLQFTCDGATVAIPAANNLNVFGGAGTVTSGAGDTITITVTASAFNWTAVTSATNPNALVTQNGYIPKGAGVVNFVLPASAAIGDSFRIAGHGNLWTLGQNAGQTITLGVKTTTAGVGGSIAASQVRDSVEILCVATDTEFQIIDGIGNLTFV